MRAIAAIAQRHGLVLIEDAAQAIGARSHGQLVGSRGTACFSLYATKNIMCGEGGIVVTDDPEVAERLRLLRAHGSRVRYQHEQLGYNYRLTDIQAAIACVQLERLPEFTQARSANAAYLSAQITHPAVTLPRVRPEVVHVFHQYTVRIHGDRDAAVRQLAAAGVGAAVFYPVPIHRQELYQKLGYHAALPVSERASREVVSLPVHPGLGAADLERIVAAVNALEVDQV
jgi:perosamine synthetase